jgi:hypothetical protein
MMCGRFQPWSRGLPQVGGEPGQIWLSIQVIKPEICDPRNGRQWPVCSAEIRRPACLNWVKKGRSRPSSPATLPPQHPKSGRTLAARHNLPITRSIRRLAAGTIPGSSGRAPWRWSD